MTRFCIVIPTFNSIATLPAAVESALAQSFDDFQVYVSDNASDDGSQEYLKSLHNPRLKVAFNDSRVSKTNNWNRAFLSAPECEYFVNLHSDDILVPNHLEMVSKLLNKYKNVALVHGHHRLVSLDGTRSTKEMGWPTTYCVSGEKFIRLQAIEAAASIVGVTFKASAFKKIGGFPARYDFLQDVAFFNEVAKFGNVVYSSAYFGYYREAPLRPQNLIRYYCEVVEWAHENQSSLPPPVARALLDQKIIEIYKVMKARVPEGLPALDALMLKLGLSYPKSAVHLSASLRKFMHRTYRTWIACT